jgi:rhamnosyltransferase subunit B
MHFLFCAVGTNGDVLPLLAIAAELRRRAHRTTLIAGRGFAETAASLSVEYVSLSTAEDHKAVARDKPILSTRYAALFMARHSVSWNQTILEAIRNRLSPDLVVVTAERPNLWADLVAHRHFAVPLIRAVIDLPALPDLIPSALPPSQVQRVLDARVGKAWSEYFGQSGTKTALNHIYRITKSVRPLVPTIALWPDWIPTNDKIRGLRKAFGFMPLPAAQNESHSDRIGPRDQLVFVAGTEGTITSWLQHFIDASSAACRELGKPGILIGSNGASDESRPQFGLTSMCFTPLHEVLIGADAVVHHGGIGTSAAALEAGIPQLAIPRVFMQPMNAEWMRRLGVCTVIHPREWTATNATKVLRDLLADQRIKSRAKELATRIDRPAALNAVCTFLENPANYR